MQKTRVFALIGVVCITLAGSCASGSLSNKKGCWGYWEKERGLKRGTRLHNQNYTKPYRQCVDETPPHIDLDKRPYG